MPQPISEPAHLASGHVSRGGADGRPRSASTPPRATSSAPSSCVSRVSVTPNATRADGGQDFGTRAICRLPHEILVNVLRYLSPTPLDLLRLGAVSRVRRDPLATAARERSLWSYYVPAYDTSDQQADGPAAQFVARMKNKPKQMRKRTLNHYDKFAKVRAPDGVYTRFFAAGKVSEEQDTDLLCARLACLHLSRTNEETRSEQSAGGPHDDEERPRDLFRWRDATPAFFSDPALMKMASRSCSEVALAASDDLFNDPTFLREYVLKPSCSGCDEEGYVPLPFPLHRLSERNLADKDLVRAALKLRPHSYNNLPMSESDDPEDFLFALSLYEQRWPCRGDRFIPKKERGLPGCIIADHFINGTYYPPCQTQWPFHNNRLAIERIVELSPDAYVELPYAHKECPNLARRYLAHVTADGYIGDEFEDFEVDFPVSLRANVSVMTQALAAPLFRLSDLEWVDSALSEDECFVASCLAKWPEISRERIVRKMGGWFREGW